MKRALVALGALALTLLLCEGLWRFWYTSGYGPTTNPHYVVHDDRLGWRYRPNAAARHATSDFDVEIHIDGEGFRRVEPPPAGSSGAPLVLLGDSLAFGWGVREGETLADELQRALRRPVASRAVSGYGTDQEWLLLESLLPKIPPADLQGGTVLVLVCENDVAEVMRERVYGKAKPRFLLEGSALRLTNVPVPYSLLERASVLYRSLKKSLTPSEPEASEFRDPAGRALVARLLAEMASRLRTRNCDLRIVGEGISQWLAPVDGAPMLEVADALRVAREREGPVRFPNDPHWNALGHRAVAGAIARWLSAQ